MYQVPKLLTSFITMMVNILRLMETKHKEVFIFTIFTMLMAKLMALDCTTILFGLLPPHQFLL